MNNGNLSPAPQPPSDDSQEGKSKRNRWLESFFRVIFFIVLVILVFGLISVLPGLIQSSGKMVVTPDGVDIFAVLVLGVLVGFIELISRYEDSPFQAATSYPGLFYMLINGLVAIAALLLIRLFGWQFIPTDTTATTGTADISAVERWSRVLIAGLGAMSIFRSSLLIIGKGDQQVSVGPSAVLEILLNTLDKEVDRVQGQYRAKLIKGLMKDISYEDARDNLPGLCKTLMQNLQQKQAEKIDKLALQVAATKITDNDVNKLRLGLELMEVVGEDVLRHAILLMKKDVKEVKDSDKPASNIYVSQSIESRNLALEYLEKKENSDEATSEE